MKARTEADWIRGIQIMRETMVMMAEALRDIQDNSPDDWAQARALVALDTLEETARAQMEVLGQGLGKSKGEMN